MVKSLTDDKFEEEKGQIVQGSMPLGSFIDVYEVPTPNPGVITGQDDKAMKFIEIHARSINTVPIYIVDEDALPGIVPTALKGGRELEPGKSVAYPLRGKDASSPEAQRILSWYTTAAGQYASVTRGR